MGVAGAQTLLSLIKQKQDLQGYRERHWTGTLQDYMEIVMSNPKVARNAYQRLHDMILSHGFTEYTRHHERYVHYHLFDDPIDGGRDAVFGLDAPLTRLVHNVKSAELRLRLLIVSSTRSPSIISSSGLRLRRPYSL